MKRQMYEDSTKTLQQAEKDALQLMTVSFKHPDSREGIQSYIHKRDPNFDGLKQTSYHQMLTKSKL